MCPSIPQLKQVIDLLTVAIEGGEKACLLGIDDNSSTATWRSSVFDSTIRSSGLTCSIICCRTICSFTSLDFKKTNLDFNLST